MDTLSPLFRRYVAASPQLQYHYKAQFPLERIEELLAQIVRTWYCETYCDGDCRYGHCDHALNAYYCYLHIAVVVVAIADCLTSDSLSL